MLAGQKAEPQPVSDVPQVGCLLVPWTTCRRRGIVPAEGILSRRRGGGEEGDGGVELDARVGVGAEVAGSWVGVDAAPAEVSVGG